MTIKTSEIKSETIQEAIREIEEKYDITGDKAEAIASQIVYTDEDWTDEEGPENDKLPVKCDRCEKEIDTSTNWGNCTKCGDNLCEKCAVMWGENGECSSCSTVEKTETEKNQICEDEIRIQIPVSDFIDAFDADLFDTNICVCELLDYISANDILLIDGNDVSCPSQPGKVVGTIKKEKNFYSDIDKYGTMCL